MVKPGDKVVWNQDGVRMEGKVREISLWRRDNLVMARVVSKGETYWVDPKILGSV